MNWGLNTVETSGVKRRTQWYAYIRLLFLLAIAVPGILTLYIFEGWSSAVRTDMAVVVLAIASNLLFYGLTVVADSRRALQVMALIWIISDVVLIALFIFVNGGIESRSPILFTVPILISAALFGRKGIYTIAGLCSILYVALIVGDYMGIIHSAGAFNPESRTDLSYVINTICFVPAVIMVVALAVDFMARLLTEKQRQLNESINALETAQEIAKLGSWEWDIARDEISWSKELYRIYGLEPGQAPTSYAAYLAMLNPDEASTHKSIVLQAMQKKAAFKVDHQIALPDGTTKYIHGEGRPVKARDGTVIKMSGTSQDMTDSYHLDVAKREFISLASHQLRTPASGVKAYLSLLLDGHGGHLEHMQRNFIAKAYDANDHQLEIIDNLLSLAAIESGKLSLHKETIAIGSFVTHCLPNYRALARSKQQTISVRKRLKPTLIHIDPGVLRMALDNLVSNASKYTAEHGKIVIALRRAKTVAYIDIIDTGIGIAKDDFPQLFQKFTRLKDPEARAVSGSGVGLYMAKYIVELHGGTLTVRSHPGAGTTFTIKLPLLQRNR